MGTNGDLPRPRPGVKHPHLLALRRILALDPDESLDEAKAIAVQGIVQGYDHDEG